MLALMAELQLCDDDGIVRSGAMHHGVDYPCTGHAHLDGVHIECTNCAHALPSKPEQVGVYWPHTRPDWQASGARAVAARVVKIPG